jgi:hypothetical protein
MNGCFPVRIAESSIQKETREFIPLGKRYDSSESQRIGLPESVLIEMPLAGGEV